jgi:hypothetical protein
MAESTPPAEVTISGSLTGMSDYIWRGQSQTWGKPALQFSVEAAHNSGVYAGFFTSNVSSQWVPGAHLETDWYSGFRNKLPGSLSEVGYDLNINYAYFPGGDFNKTGFNLPSSSPNTVEVSASVNHHWLTLKAGQVLSKFYGWDTNNSSAGSFAGDPKAAITGSTKGSYYVEAQVSQDIAEGWNINGQVGRQTIRNSVGLDWSYYKLGVYHTVDQWNIGLAFTGGSQPDAFKNFVGLTNNGSTYSAARPAVVGSVARSF